MKTTKMIYIYGAGGHGLVVADIARSVGYDEIIFLDDNKENKFNPALKKADIVVAIGNNKTRKEIMQKVQNAGFNLVSLIHPSSVISPSTKIGNGVVIMPNVVINASAIIQDGVILNSSCVIEHECFIDGYSHISPNVSLAGNVKVGELTHIGIGSCIIECVKIGKNCIIGAGSTVLKDVDDNSKVYGIVKA
ncbi:acetyltransferase [Campylobacter pinnipediorum subsp. pinnipediorum]|uniref:Acetyltransferase n=1 Tax=Campylobacter pinnipediorum subsp. pinnipediorum TaxID=1660067 RepID=A0AAX0L9W0_9BACT|nr:UDP-N-acetylbacillosamine N-acetyltransferase [Campylobacter pinnipediorum]OPA77940.1 acetyltransferase [Campylobacter pinnipediorum subsp. pinnipediorum]